MADISLADFSCHRQCDLNAGHVSCLWSSFMFKAKAEIIWRQDCSLILNHSHKLKKPDVTVMTADLQSSLTTAHQRT